MRTARIRAARGDSFSYAAPAATRALVEATGLTDQEAEAVIGVSLDVMAKAPEHLWSRYAGQLCDAGLEKRAPRRSA